MDEKKLHVFCNGVDSVIAYDPDDAIAVWEKTVEEKYWDYHDENEDYRFEQVPDENTYVLYEEEMINSKHQQIPNGAELLERGEYSFTHRATCRAWADARGRCFLGSAEY